VIEFSQPDSGRGAIGRTMSDESVDFSGVKGPDLNDAKSCEIMRELALV